MYKIIDYRLNQDKHEGNISFFIFDILVENIETEHTNWLSIDYELFFDWLMQHDEKLKHYLIAAQLIDDFEHTITEMCSLGYEWSAAFLKYVQTYYPTDVFMTMDYYNPIETF